MHCQRPGLDLSAQAQAIAYHITVKFVGVAVFETHLDSTSLPHVDMINTSWPPRDQSKKDSDPVGEAMR